MTGRHFNKKLHRLLRHFPIVYVLGPRQCGKTTFIRASLSRWQYLGLERPRDYVRLSEDPEDTLTRLRFRFILDEVQRLPTLFPMMRSFVDRD